LLDTGAGISRNVMSFVLACDEVVVVTTPELTAITDAYGVIKLVMSANPHARVRVVVNMARDERQAQHVLRSLTTVVKQFLRVEFTLELLGFVPLDAAVGKAVQEQRPFVIAYPQSRAARSIAAIAHRLVNDDDPGPRRGFGAVFRRVAEAMRKKGKEPAFPK